MTRPTGLLALLREEGLVPEAILRAAERDAQAQGRAFVRVLCEQVGLSEDTLLATLERRLGLARADLSPHGFDAEALRALPADLVERFAVLPLALSEQAGRRVLRLAMADPLDHGAVEEVEFQTGCRVIAELAPCSELTQVIEQHYRGLTTKLIRQDGAGPSAGATGDEAELEPRSSEGPTTAPAHQLVDEASLDVRLRALLQALYAKNLLTEEDFVRALKSLLQQPG
jgi:hypothetical protein